MPTQKLPFKSDIPEAEDTLNNNHFKQICKANPEYQFFSKKKTECNRKFLEQTPTLIPRCGN